MTRFPNWTNDIETFVDYLGHSQIVDPTMAVALRDDFQKSSQPGATICDFCSFLIARGVLTYWQCHKLRNAQYKGFVTDDYLIIDYVTCSSEGNVFLARHREKQNVVCLAFGPGEYAYFEVRPAPPCFP